jgi:hypothetical protein
MVKEDLRRITPKRLRGIGWLQYRALIGHSASLAAITLMALGLIKTTLKRCDCSSLLPPKGILEHCTGSQPVSGKKPFACSGAPLQGVAFMLQTLCSICARELCVFQQQLHPPHLILRKQ